MKHGIFSARELEKSHWRVNPDIPELARIVVERCRGSPLALNVIGVTMKGKTLVQEWRHAIDALALSTAKFSGMEDEILPVLKFGYDNLKDERIKQCLLYCALFPEDELVKEDLVEYWIDEGIIDGKEDRYRAEKEGYEIFRYLVHACLLVEHKFGERMIMPTLVRDMALWVASDFGQEKENFIVKGNANLDDIPKVKDWRAVSRMSLMDNHINNISCSPDCPKLTTLFLQENFELKEIPSGFFMFMPSLVVLDLAGNYNLSELPEEISRLVSLQYLNLSNTQINELPRGLKEVRKLIHLNLEFTCLEGVDGISSSSNLQVLKLNGSFDLDIKLVEELQLLKHLKVLTVSVGDACVWKQLMSIPRLASCTRSVMFTHCEVGADGLSIAATSSILNVLTIYESKIREIKIDQKTDDESKTSPKTLSNTWNFRHLVQVEISECQGLRDLTWLLFAPNLIWLDVRDSPQLKEIISKDKAASFMSGEADDIMPFLKLRHLDLNNLEELDSVYWSPLSFPCLMKIYVYDCPNLLKLPLGPCSASSCDLVIHGEEEWIQKLQWDDEDTKERFTLKTRYLKSRVPVAAYPQNQSELELRKRVADLEEENRSIKQRLERIEMLLWQQQQEKQRFMPPPQSSIQTVVHQQRAGSQSNVPVMQLFQQQPSMIQKDVQPMLQGSGMLPPQNVIHQQRQSQRSHPEMPSTSLDTRGDDWQEEVFQKIKSMKEVYLADVTEIYKKVSAKLQSDCLVQQQRSEQFEKLKQLKTMSDGMIGFLSVSKSNIMPDLKDKVDYYEKQIIHFLNMHSPSEAH